MRGCLYDFKIISKQRYNDVIVSIVRAEYRTNYVIDFAIYGEKFVWETTEGHWNNEVTSGNFSMKNDKVIFYRHIFEKLWQEVAEDYPIGKRGLQLFPFPEYSLIDLHKLYEYRKQERFQ